MVICVKSPKPLKKLKQISQTSNKCALEGTLTIFIKKNIWVN